MTCSGVGAGLHHNPNGSRTSLLPCRSDLPRLKRPLFDRLARFDLPAWPPRTIEFVLFGPAHEACQRHFAGEDAAIGWLRTNRPELATRTLF
jgi:hypothetical protein